MLDDSRKSNDAVQMRKAMDAAQKSLAEMKEHMSGCMAMMENMGQMHGGMMGEKGTKGEKGMMGGGMMSSEKKAAAKVTDPVCGMEVDPQAAPTASYSGKTYYFCSPDDKAKFEKNPETYVKKKPA
ncbi:MAG: YHS domain-containing protein [Acidobacteriota bacterium]|nr:YHS domain-containing protein [Acidobacteriota bacterium]